jgi:hypothetical protein
MMVVHGLDSLAWDKDERSGEDSIAAVVGVCEVAMPGLGWMVDHWMWVTGGSAGELWDVVVIEDSFEVTARNTIA